VALVRAEFVVPVPDQVQSPAAAAAPLMLTTALLLLQDAARFRPGETVLMHSASDGVGSAVAQLVPVLGGGLRIGTVGIVLDPLGAAMLKADLAVTAPGARIVLFGNAGGGEQAPLPSTGRLIGGNLAIGGFSIRRLWATAPHRASSGLRRVLDLITQGTSRSPKSVRSRT
jgi:NADPH:quinone reductase